MVDFIIYESLVEGVLLPLREHESLIVIVNKILYPNPPHTGDSFPL
jgi:hypothetical protein